ncbi:response regulator [Spartinivicinus ruber]|uniref:response regulator n=1 Tax=Spartinivicinus ruber TaxID=2683272 RepID=UPI0013D6F3FE|nr:response regulator [Spartinivicinus ruber]
MNMTERVARSRPAEILLVEDNEDDVLLTRESFNIAKFAVKLHHVENGKECMAFLRKEGKYADMPMPDLVLLDLNMPVMSGHEVLRQIVKDENLQHLPVVILTTSESDQDVLAMYKLRCSSYITKPVDFDKFQTIISHLNMYWFTVVVLPPK